MEHGEKPVAVVQMLIRKPVREVFEAFVDPAITTRFWFTKSSGKLEPGKVVHWAWEMYGASAEVHVLEVEEDQGIRIEWSGNGVTTTVEWEFEARAEGATLVRIMHRGFPGSDEQKLQQALDSKGGFSLVLAGLKALLEHDIRLNLVADQYPDSHV